MAKGDKRPVVMQSDRGVANGIATLDENGKLVQMPTSADVGATAFKTISARLSTSGWYRVGTIGNSGAWRFVCAGTYGSNNMRWTIVDVVSAHYYISATKVIRTPSNDAGSHGFDQIRFVRLDNGRIAVDCYYYYSSTNLVNFYAVPYTDSPGFTPAASMERITDEVTPILTLSLD